LQKIKLKKIINNFETNDYLLDWRKKTRISNKNNLIRYCHYLDENTSQDLFRKAKFQILDQFFADGKSQQLNQYFVLKKAD
jgi:hypothetical protein